MTVDWVMDIARETVWTLVQVALPMLLVSLIIGLVISIFQTVTSIQEQTLTFVPKFVATMLVIILFGSWILNQVSGLFTSLLTQVISYVG